MRIRICLNICIRIRIHNLIRIEVRMYNIIRIHNILRIHNPCINHNATSHYTINNNVKCISVINERGPRRRGRASLAQERVLAPRRAERRQ